MINPSTDLAELSKRAFAPLANVTDDWLKTVQVERVADGSDVRNLTGDQMASLMAVGGGLKSCCVKPGQAK